MPDDNDYFVMNTTMNNLDLPGETSYLAMSETEFALSDSRAGEGVKDAIISTRKGTRAMSRGLNGAIMAMGVLNISLPGATGAAAYLKDALNISLLAYSAYEMYIGIINSQEMIEAAMAAVETAAEAVAQNWVGIALAGAAAAAVFAAFEVDKSLTNDIDQGPGQREFGASVGAGAG